MGRFKHVVALVLLGAGAGAALGWAAAPVRGDDPPPAPDVSPPLARQEHRADPDPQVSATTASDWPTASYSAEELRAFEAQAMNVEAALGSHAAGPGYSDALRSLDEEAERIERESGDNPPPRPAAEGEGRPRHIRVQASPEQRGQKADSVAAAEAHIRHLEEAADRALREAEQSVRAADRAVREAED